MSHHGFLVLDCSNNRWLSSKVRDTLCECHDTGKRKEQEDGKDGGSENAFPHGCVNGEHLSTATTWSLGGGSPSVDLVGQGFLTSPVNSASNPCQHSPCANDPSTPRPQPSPGLQTIWSRLSGVSADHAVPLFPTNAARRACRVRAGHQVDPGAHRQHPPQRVHHRGSGRDAYLC